MQSEHSDSTLRGAELQRLLNLVERLSNGPPEELPASHRTLKAVLEIIAQLTWPIAVVFIVWLLISNNTISNILNNRSITYKNEDMVIESNQNKNEDISDLNGLFSLMVEENDLENNDLAKAIKKKIHGISENLAQDLDKIAQSPGGQNRKGAYRGYSAPQAVSSGSYINDGFAALLERDIDGAISSFEAAKESNSNIRDIAAILELLTKERSSLKSRQSPDWGRVFAAILVDYSWDIPSEFRTEIRDIALDYYR